MLNGMEAPTGTACQYNCLFLLVRSNHATPGLKVLQKLVLLPEVRQKPRMFYLRKRKKRRTIIGRRRACQALGELRLSISCCQLTIKQGYDQNSKHSLIVVDRETHEEPEAGEARCSLSTLDGTEVAMELGNLPYYIRDSRKIPKRWIIFFRWSTWREGCTNPKLFMPITSEGSKSLYEAHWGLNGTPNRLIPFFHMCDENGPGWRALDFLKTWTHAKEPRQASFALTREPSCPQMPVGSPTKEGR